MANRVQYQVDAGHYDDYGRPQRSAEADPLRELARLIGQNDPNSSFAAEHQAQAAHYADDYADAAHHQAYDQTYAEAPQAGGGPAWMRTASEGRAASPLGGRATPLPQPAFEPEQADYEPPPLSQPPAFLRARQQREAQAPQYAAQQYAEPARYDDALYGQNPDNIQYQDQYYQQQNAGYQDQYEQYDPTAYQRYTEEPPRARRGGLVKVGVVLALAFLGTASAFAYRSYMGASHNGEPPVIKAEPGANKIVPQQTADAAAKINDRVGALNGPERVVSREEQPVDINARNQPRVVFPPLNQNSNPPSVQSVSTTAPIVANAAPVNGAVGDEPKRVRTTTIRPNEPPPAAAQPRASAPTAARAQMPAGATPAASSPISLSPNAAQPVRTAAIAQPATSGGFAVQVTSQRSEADAQSAYRAIQAKYSSVLGSRSAMIRRADLGQRGIYYRAMVGPFSDAEDASQLCNSLKSAGGQCVVQRN